ncbi:hypothetical protein ARMGADRAFT_625411 [Armillaria gallica]|uniref:Uncharacterized protein n=1 Tax=Armillaria gallica TaxID=47427 RepID=A0A2H3EC52_ARMGA|nr:hypothetical protein ARMGADRAFT_625411 [Armillaria gallica]
MCVTDYSVHSPVPRTWDRWPSLRSTWCILLVYTWSCGSSLSWFQGSIPIPSSDSELPLVSLDFRNFIISKLLIAST